MGRDTRNKAAAQTATPEPRKLSDAELASIHDDTRRMGVAERVAYWDKRQAARNDDGTRADTVVLCPNDRSHGPLTMTSSGALLICGERRQGAVCTGSVPVSI